MAGRSAAVIGFADVPSIEDIVASVSVLMAFLDATHSSKPSAMLIFPPRPTLQAFRGFCLQRKDLGAKLSGMALSVFKLALTRIIGWAACNPGDTEYCRPGPSKVVIR